MEPRDSMPSNGAPESLKADCSGGYARSGERTIRRNGADRERALNTRLKLTSGPVIARPLVREPRLSCCTPPIPQVGQEAPLGVQHAHLAEAPHPAAPAPPRVGTPPRSTVGETRLPPPRR